MSPRRPYPSERYRVLYKERFAGRYIEQLVQAQMQETELSQARLAERAGMWSPHITNYKKGITLPGPSNRRRLVEHFGADPDYLEELIAADELAYWMRRKGKSVGETARVLELVRKKARE